MATGWELTDFATPQLDPFGGSHGGLPFGGGVVLDKPIGAFQRYLRQPAKLVKDIVDLALGYSITGQVAYSWLAVNWRRDAGRAGYQ